MAKSRDGARIYFNINDIKENNPMLYGMLFTEMMTQFEQKDMSRYSQLDKFTDWNVYVDEVEPDIPKEEYGIYHYDAETYDSQTIAEILCNNCSGDGCDECDSGTTDWDFSDGEDHDNLCTLIVEDDVVKYNQTWWRKYLNSDKTTPIYNTRDYSQAEIDELIDKYKDVDKIISKDKEIAKIRDKEYEEAQTRYYEYNKLKDEHFEVVMIGKNHGTNYEERILLETLVFKGGLDYYTRDQLHKSMKAKYANIVEGYGENIKVYNKNVILPDQWGVWELYDTDHNMLGEHLSPEIRYESVISNLKDKNVRYMKYKGKATDEQISNL